MQCEVKGWVASFDLCCLLLQLSARLRKGDCKVHPTGSFKCHNENWSLYGGTRMIAFIPQYSWVLSVSLALLAINLPPLQLVNPTVAKGARRLLGSQTRCLSDALSAVTSIRPSLQDDIFSEGGSLWESWTQAIKRWNGSPGIPPSPEAASSPRELEQ